MKWFIFVLFLTNEPGEPNAYLFTTPTFDTQQQCAVAVVNPSTIPIFVNKLIQEFGKTPAIKSINCINQETIDKIDKMINHPEAKSI
tara:strand:- start:2156 stop:2416 length:261 start_codon:yes stop_codon:yes gene_type:complete